MQLQGIKHEQLGHDRETSGTQIIVLPGAEGRKQEEIKRPYEDCTWSREFQNDKFLKLLLFVLLCGVCSLNSSKFLLLHSWHICYPRGALHLYMTLSFTCSPQSCMMLCMKIKACFLQQPAFHRKMLHLTQLAYPPSCLHPPVTTPDAQKTICFLQGVSFRGVTWCYACCEVSFETSRLNSGYWSSRCH